MNYQMENRKRLPLKAIVLLMVALAISCGKKNQKKQWEKQNLQIIHAVLEHRCAWVNSKKDVLKKYRYVLLRDMEGSFLKKYLKNGIAESSLVGKFRQKIGLMRELFSEENIEYYLKQLNSTKNISYTKNIEETSCIKRSPPYWDSNLPYSCGWQCFTIGKAVFTKNNQYALFITKSSSIGISVYKNNGSEFIPFLSVIVGIF